MRLLLYDSLCKLYLSDALLVSQASRQLPSDPNVTCTLCDLSTKCRRKVGLAGELTGFFVEVQPGEPSLGPKEQLGEVPNPHIFDRVVSCCVQDPLAGLGLFVMNSDVQKKQNCYNDPDWCPQQEDSWARSNCRSSRNRTSGIGGS